MKNGVRFGEYHSLDDLGLIFNTKTISEPKAQTNMVSVPSRNGLIDMSEVLTGNIRYDDRTIQITFTITDNVNNWESKRMELANLLHGKKMRIIFDDDQAFYWLGRVTVGDLKPKKTIAEITIKATVDPYKYNITTSEEDWLWDPFDFEFGIINETANLVIDGSREVVIIGGQRWENPIITSDTGMTVTFNDVTYEINEGSQVLYDIIIEEGENTLIFNGNGTVSINYVGGSL